MTKSQKDFIITAFDQNEKNINHMATCIGAASLDCTRVHSANGDNIAGYAARLVEYKGVRQGMISMLINLGYDLVFDGERLVDIKEETN